MSIEYRDGFQKRLCNIAKLGFAVEIIYPIGLRSMLMGQGRCNPLGKCFPHTALKGIVLPIEQCKKNCANCILFNCYSNCERKLFSINCQTKSNYLVCLKLGT